MADVPRTKLEAIAFVSTVLRKRQVYSSPDFQTAMDLSVQFDIRVADLLAYRRSKATLP